MIVVSFLFAGLADMNAQWGKKIKGNGNVTTKTVNTGDYDAIRGIGSMDIHLEKGTEGNISVTTDDNLHEYLEIEVKDNTLLVKTKKNVNIYTKNGIHVKVPFTDISEVALTGSGDIDTKDTIKADNLEVVITGSGDIELDVEARMVDAKVTGSGDMVLTGKTNDLAVKVTGSGDFRGFDLDAQNTEASVSGSGDIRVVAKRNLKARVHGSGDITYKGNPERRDTKTSGSGDISSF